MTLVPFIILCSNLSTADRGSYCPSTGPRTYLTGTPDFAGWAPETAAGLVHPTPGFHWSGHFHRTVAAGCWACCKPGLAFRRRQSWSPAESRPESAGKALDFANPPWSPRGVDASTDIHSLFVLFKCGCGVGGGRDENEVVRVWNHHTGRPRATTTRHTTHVKAYQTVVALFVVWGFG